tara:strand:- start:603 stop:1277 length:675 start_codon:yes stop_codon:yes gene_type:complete
MTTERLSQTITAMLKENTGKNFLDSGGSSNRHWQRNQSVEDFSTTEPVTWELDTYNGETDLLVTLNVYHYLMDLSLDDRCVAFNSLQDSDGGDWVTNSDFYGITQSGVDYLEELIVPNSIGRTFNTYNDESILSQTLQGTFIDIDDEKYVLLQIHGGADVRGGYTTSKLFNLGGEYMPDDQGIYGTIDGVDVHMENIKFSTNGFGEIVLTPDSKINLDYYGAIE